jgi:hypothetical protein
MQSRENVQIGRKVRGENRGKSTEDQDQTEMKTLVRQNERRRAKLNDHSKEGIESESESNNK